MKKKLDAHHGKTLRTISLEDLGNVRGGDDGSSTKRPDFGPGTLAEEDSYGDKQKHWVPV